MKLKNLATAVVLCTTLAASAQDNVIDAKGDMYFDNECYPRALTEYLKAYTKRPNSSELLRRITETILKDESPRSAACVYIDRYINMVSDDVEAYMMAARAHYHAHHFGQARKYLSDYEAMITSEEDKKAAANLRQCIDVAQAMVKDSLGCVFANLGEMINTPNHEINPYIINDNQTLVYAADDKYISELLMNYFNVKVSDSYDLGWKKAKVVSGATNSIYDEYSAGTTANGIIYNSNRDGEFALFEVEKYSGNGRLSEGKKLLPPIDRKGHEVAGSTTVTGDTLIFSGTCDNGKLDLFYSIRFKGVWAEPRPLPGQVNTPDFDENYPVLTNGGKRLYFSSDRPGTMGGFDLYYSDFDDKAQEWGKPVHLRYPLNDTYDNLTISFTSDGRYAYVSAIREEGLGGRDIYSVIFGNILPTTAVLKYSVGLKSKSKPVLLSEQPLIEVVDADGEVVAALKMKMSNSTFILALDPGTYTLTIDADEAKPYSENIVIEEKYYNSQIPIEKRILLDPK